MVSVAHVSLVKLVSILVLLAQEQPIPFAPNVAPATYLRANVTAHTMLCVRQLPRAPEVLLYHRLCLVVLRLVA